MKKLTWWKWKQWVQSKMQSAENGRLIPKKVLILLFSFLSVSTKSPAYQTSKSVPTCKSFTSGKTTFRTSATWRTYRQGLIPIGNFRPQPCTEMWMSLKWLLREGKNPSYFHTTRTFPLSADWICFLTFIHNFLRLPRDLKIVAFSGSHEFSWVPKAFLMAISAA